METILSSKTKTVVISPDKPFVVIGERINPTGRKKLAEEIAAGDFSRVRSDALAQIEAGAHVLDVNSGVPGADEPAIMRQAVQMVMETVDAPLCFDSPNPAALEAALAIYSGKALINSTTGEDAALERVLPLAKKYGAAFIGLCNDDHGISQDPLVRLEVARKIINRAADYGIPAADIVIDPLVLTVGADSNAAAVTLKTIQLVRERFGVNINLGASNVSFGLPDRHTINQAFLALAIGQGATCVITDPMKLTATIRAADLLLGRDTYSKRWVSFFRQHPPEAK